MKNFRINLSQFQNKNKFQPYLFYALGVLYFLTAVMHFNSYNSIWRNSIWIVGGLIFILGNYYQQHYQSKYFFEISDDLIKFRQTISNPTKIMLSDISLIKLKPISIVLTLNNNFNKEISLANVSYKNALDIKNKLREVVVSKNVIIE